MANGQHCLPNRFEYTAYGTKLTYEFNTFVVRDLSEKALLANPNLYTVVFIANLYVLQTLDGTEDAYLRRLELKKKPYQIATLATQNLLP